MSRPGDAVRLAVGTFSAVPVPPPRVVDRPTAGLALLLAPLAVVPIGVLVAGVAWAARELTLPSLATGVLAIGVGGLGTRAFHLDGLADTVDALAASHDRERSLAVARTGDVGPAGAAALVLVLLLQCSAAGALVTATWGPVAVGLVWCLARAAATVGLRRGVPAARADGMGATFAGSVPTAALLVQWLLAGAALAGSALLLGSTVVAGVLVCALALVTVMLLVRHVVRRLGGIIGDAVGASVELCLAVLLLGLATAL